MEQLQTWWVTALYMPIDGDSCMEIPGDCEVVKAADAQATVEALQVRAEQAERLVASQAQEIMQRRQTLGDLAHLHQEQSKQLTQRTAELEAAKRGIDTARTRYDNLSTESYKQIAVLQAELERQTKVNREMNAYWQGKLDGAENSLAGLRKGRA